MSCVNLNSSFINFVQACSNVNNDVVIINKISSIILI